MKTKIKATTLILLILNRITKKKVHKTKKEPIAIMYLLNALAEIDVKEEIIK